MKQREVQKEHLDDQTSRAATGSRSAESERDGGANQTKAVLWLEEAAIEQCRQQRVQAAEQQRSRRSRNGKKQRK